MAGGKRQPCRINSKAFIILLQDSSYRLALKSGFALQAAELWAFMARGCFMAGDKGQACRINSKAFIILLQDSGCRLALRSRFAL